MEIIVTVFYPHTIGMFIDTPPSAFYNQEISGYDIGNKQLNLLADRIFDCADSETAISLIEQWLTAQIRPSLNIERIGESLAALLREYVGMNPKEYGRIARFQRALRMMQLGSRDYADIAYANGYSDQSHFIRDFRQFSGMTPKQLAGYQAPYSDLYTVPV